MMITTLEDAEEVKQLVNKMFGPGDKDDDDNNEGGCGGG